MCSVFAHQHDHEVPRLRLASISSTHVEEKDGLKYEVCFKSMYYVIHKTKVNTIGVQTGVGGI